MNLTDLIQALRGGLIQQDRLVKTDIPSLPDNALVPRRAVTYSELGRDFSVTLDMVSTASDIELKTLIAQPMTLWIQQADKSYLPINGYIHTARRLGAEGSQASYQLDFASWMHFLRFRRDMRYWQDQSVDAIMTDVFNAHPQASGQFQFALSKPLPSRSYCRQSESDWNFVHRLMEEEGLFGFWRQSKDGKSHTLVVTDDVHSLDEISVNPVGFYRSGTGSEADAFTQWSGSRTLQSSMHTTRTFDYKAPSSNASPKGTTLPTMDCEASSEERSWSPARVRPCGSQRHPVRVQNGNSLEPLADSSGLWLGRHMLAAIERLAKGWCMGPTARVATRQVACGRPNRSVIRCGRFVVRARRWGGRKTGPNPTDRARPGSKHHVLVDANGVPLVAILTGANTNDVTQLLPLVDAIPPIRGVRGRPLQKPGVVYADRGYDSTRHRRALRERGIKPVIAKRRTEHGSGLGKYRWVTVGTGNCQIRSRLLQLTGRSVQRTNSTV